MTETHPLLVVSRPCTSELRDAPLLMLVPNLLFFSVTHELQHVVADAELREEDSMVESIPPFVVKYRAKYAWRAHTSQR